MCACLSFYVCVRARKQNFVFFSNCYCCYNPIIACCHPKSLTWRLIRPDGSRVRIISLFSDVTTISDTPPSTSTLYRVCLSPSENSFWFLSLLTFIVPCPFPFPRLFSDSPAFYIYPCCTIFSFFRKPFPSWIDFSIEDKMLFCAKNIKRRSFLFPGNCMK